jgi:hypothetical protein
LAERGILVVDDDMNRLNLPDAQKPKRPLGVIGDAIAGVLMRDSGTLAGQSRDMSQTYSGTDRTSP